MTTTITGLDAIRYATATGVTLRKHADPVDGAREVSTDEAREIVREDAGLIYCEAPAATARRESAPPHGCTGARCETCGDDTPAANAVAQWEARVAEATAELAHARDGLLRAKGDDTPALVRYAVARLLRTLLLPCAARIAATATTAGEWHDVAVEAAASCLATRSDSAQTAYHTASLMEAGDVVTAAACCAAHAEMSVERWRAHTRWVIADGNNNARGA